mgnify:CR=1 FL=1
MKELLKLARRYGMPFRYYAWNYILIKAVEWKIISAEKLKKLAKTIQQYE